jgi:hypothetical protein
MHPYTQRPAQAFWRRFISNTPWSDVDFVGTAKFKLSKETRVSMAGSCFAQHISKHMRKRGIEPFRTECAHPFLEEIGADTSSYQAFSARFGNIYTSRQCLELFQQAFGIRVPIEDFVEHHGRIYDQLRPNAVPDGFSSLDEARADRMFHLHKVREMFENTDVFVYTLGLTESWFNAQDGYTYPVCPGTVRGEYVPELHKFRNLTHSEVKTDLCTLVEGAKQFNSRLKFIFTVSPVPLVATYTQKNVLAASVYSKSVLRSACGEVTDSFDDVMYFPSFEIISHPASFGQYLDSDLREVTERGVSHVMRCFFSSVYSDLDQVLDEASEASFPATNGPEISNILDAECEEMFNDFGRSTRS